MHEQTSRYFKHTKTWPILDPEYLLIQKNVKTTLDGCKQEKRKQTKKKRCEKGVNHVEEILKIDFNIQVELEQ